MDKRKKVNISSLVFVVVILLLIFPKTRTPIQVVLHKGLSYINQSSIINDNDRKRLSAPNFTLVSNDKRTLKFANTKGKVVFVNFWATWCPPCIAEMPSIQLLYNDYKDKVEFLLITSDDFDTVNEFMTKNNYDFEVFHQTNEAPPEFSIRTIPRTFILNKKSEIVVDESGAINWNSENVRQQLDQLLSK